MCDAVNVRSEGVEVELQVPWHGLEVASADLHRQVVGHRERQLALGLADALEIAAERDIGKRRRLRRVRCSRSRYTVVLGSDSSKGRGTRRDVRYSNEASVGQRIATSSASASASTPVSSRGET